MFSIFVAKSKNFAAPAEVSPLATSEPEQEEEVAPPVIDLVLLSLVHQRVVQDMPHWGDLPVATVKMEHVSPTRTALEQGVDLPELETGSSLVLRAFSSSSTSDLVEATESSSSMLTVGSITAPDFRFLEVVLLKTNFLKITPIVVTPPIVESCIMILSQ